MNELQGSPARGPLGGVLVVAIEQAVASPLATRTLADLGATVIKIENPVGGDDFTRRYHDVATPVGPVCLPVPPLTFDGQAPGMGPVPGLGEHTKAVLAELEIDPTSVSR